jgi:hypothetical protein
MSFLGKWSDPEIIMFNEINHSQRVKYRIVFFRVGSLGRQRKDVKVKGELL